jgi:hypothetical protein
MEDTVIECFYCKEPVLPADAFLCTLESETGSFVAVFHKYPRLCPLTYALELLEKASLDLKESLVAFKKIAEEAKKGKGKLGGKS